MSPVRPTVQLIGTRLDPGAHRVRSLHDPQRLYSAHPQARVHDRARVDPHFAGPAGMKNGDASIAREVQQLSVSPHVLTWHIFISNIARQSGLGRDSARNLEPRHICVASSSVERCFGCIAGGSLGSRDLIRTYPALVGRNWHAEQVKPEKSCSGAPGISAESAAK